MSFLFLKSTQALICLNTSTPQILSHNSLITTTLIGKMFLPSVRLILALPKTFSLPPDALNTARESGFNVCERVELMHVISAPLSSNQYCEIPLHFTGMYRELLLLIVEIGTQWVLASAAEWTSVSMDGTLVDLIKAEDEMFN